MIPYRKFRPTAMDSAGLGCEDRQDWLVAPVIRTRDSGVLETSNWEVIRKDLEEHDTGEDMEIHRFGHWGPGWFEIILVRPDSKCARVAEEWEGALSDYPVASEEHLSQLENEEALKVWQNCYTVETRIKYIRNNPVEFEFHNLAEMMACVRGETFCGYASEMAGS